MKILYLGYFIAPQTFDRLCVNNSEMSVAAHKYEKTLLKYLIAGEGKRYSLDILSSFAMKQNILKFPESEMYLGKKINYIFMSRSSVCGGLRALTKAKSFISDWLAQDPDEEKMILSYALNPVLLLPVFFPKKMKNTHIVTICSEIPQFRIIDGNKIKGKIKYGLLRRMNEKMDGYVFLSSYMNEVCNIRHKPWTVVEGLPDIPENEVFQQETTLRGKYLFYAGGLEPEYGINMLVDGFMKLPQEDLELWLCGKGTSEAYIIQSTKKDSRIHYLGMKKNEEVISMERQAMLLVNPRPPEGKFTRYSFPSKTIEYMMSGTPAMITMLDGIPKEYYKHCYVCDSTSPHALADSVCRVLSVPQSERLALAGQAREFILNEKAAKPQVERLIGFLQSLSELR